MRLSAPRAFFFILIMFSALWPCGCRRSEQDEAPETERTQAIEAGVRVSPEARKSIGLMTAPVQPRMIASTIPGTGWLAVKPGSAVCVKAAFTGFLTPDEESRSVSLGETVAEGQNLGTLRVCLSPQDEARLVALKEETDIRIRQAKATLERARARFERLEALSAGGGVAGKEKELAKEAFEHAKAAYEETQQELPFLPSEPYARPLRLRDVPVRSPRPGRVTKLCAPPGQFVVQGDPLWEISDWSSLWLRVPVFEGELPRIDRAASIEVNRPGLESPVAARPVGVPQPTEDGRRTVDLFYEIANPGESFRPGEAVSVELPTGETAKRIVVPSTAVLWDGTGNTWAYVEVQEGVFRRRKIQIGPASGNTIAVERGLREGEMVVTVGAEVLYGEEFKEQIESLEDDD